MTWFLLLVVSVAPSVVLLGVWWRGLTARGAVAGMLSGGLAAGLALLVHGLIGGVGAAAPYLAQPAAWTIPLRGGRLQASGPGCHEDALRRFALRHGPPWSRQDGSGLATCRASSWRATRREKMAA